MPKKIKKEKELKFKKENKILNVNNVHYYFIALIIIAVIICIGVGIYVSSEDKYHVHKDQALVSFSYSEKVENGFNVYYVNEMQDKNIYATINTPEETVEKQWGRNKYLDFKTYSFQAEVYFYNFFQIKCYKLIFLYKGKLIEH